ncbi:MAG: toluene tolerance protein [Nitrospinae bacterium CG11_big_fil_rev_8_21_14_0_20_45_15]|nr:MAG: toluene tolerance protein [Nitrospinae bacterium CG11_big_fil_rev_8_21_14_0_20_45_15]
MANKRLSNWLCSWFLAVVLILAPSMVSASQITEDLKVTIDAVIKIVTDPNYKKDATARREKLRELFGKRFNYKQMVIRSLAKDWDERTPEEREQFIGLFRQLLEKSYAGKLESYKDEKIVYLDEQVKGEYALVKTQIIRNDATIDVDYKLFNEDGEWRVYDFVIERVSMIRNYRSQFTKIIRKDSYSGLVAKLEKKIKDIESKDGDDSL